MNNNDTNNGLNTFSLGNIDNSNNNLNVPISDIPPIVPEEAVETLDTQLNMEEDKGVAETAKENANNVNTIPVESDVPEVPIEPLNNENLDIIMDTTPVFNEIGTVPPINNTNSIPVQPVAPTIDAYSSINYDIPQSINDFNTSPMFNDIGTVPPIPNSPIGNVTDTNPNPKKKGMNKTLFVLIIVLALTAVGVGVYIFLHMSKFANSPVNTKSLQLEIGSEVSSNISDYATFNGVDSANCSLDTSSIDTSIYNAEYTYTITCNGTNYTGKVKIVDTVKPVVVTKVVNVQVNNDVTVESFIESCADNTKCSYAFKYEDKIKSYLATPESYHVDIIVTDEAGNETEVTGTMVVSNTIANVYLVCSKNYSSYSEVTKLGLIESVFNKSAVRTYTFKFNNSDSYNTFKTANANKSQVTYNNITGSPEFNDLAYTLILTRIMNYDELNIEAGSTVPTSISELKTFYQNKGYKCNIGY